MSYIDGMKHATNKAIRNFHLPLPDRVYKKLRKEAEKLNRPATALAREAIEKWLEQRYKQALREAISDYARRYAGTRVDLDEQLEEASVEHLVDEYL